MIVFALSLTAAAVRFGDATASATFSVRTWPFAPAMTILPEAGRAAVGADDAPPQRRDDRLVGDFLLGGIKRCLVEARLRQKVEEFIEEEEGATNRFGGWLGTFLTVSYKKYEGTDTIQSLIVGRDVTGISAFA